MRQLTIEDLADVIEESCAVTRPASERAVHAVLEALGAALPPSGQGHIARVVDGTAPHLARGGHRVARDLDDIVRFVADTTGATPAEALEELVVVCGAIGGSWSDEDRLVVTSDLEPDVARLFEDRPPAEALPRRAPGVETSEPGPGDERHTLSTGRPGSHHPLATSAAGDPDSAAARNPHGGEKLSSGIPSLERGGNTLARGRPRGSTHPTD